MHILAADARQREEGARGVTNELSSFKVCKPSNPADPASITVRFLIIGDLIMKLFSLLFILTGILTLTTLVNAQAQPIGQTAPAKVGVINSDTFSRSTGGITRLVSALRTVDIEFKARRDEITQLVDRFNALQTDAVRTPTPAKRDQLTTLQTDIQRKQEDARVAYTKRLSAMTNPVRLTIFNALEAYAKQRGIDVLLDMSKFPEGILLVNPNADLTAGFIRDFNSKNP